MIESFGEAVLKGLKATMHTLKLRDYDLAEAFKIALRHRVIISRRSRSAIDRISAHIMQFTSRHDKVMQLRAIMTVGGQAVVERFVEGAISTSTSAEYREC